MISPATSTTVTDLFEITLLTEEGRRPIAARRVRDHIFVDINWMAKVLGARASKKNGTYLFEFPFHALSVDPSQSRFSVRTTGEEEWKKYEFPKKSYVAENRLMAPMDSLPDLFQESFSYHRQKRILQQIPAFYRGYGQDRRTVSVRHIRKDRKLWISIVDLANAVGLVVQPTNLNRYLVVLPDLSIYELRIGQNIVYQRNRPALRLNDPVFLFSGTPYITVASINPLFNMSVQWNPRSKKLIIPARYGRLRKIEAESEYDLVYKGYKREPLRFKVDEFVGFYQEPAPAYSANHWDLYDSIRDIWTSDPIIQEDETEDRIGGEAVLALEGTMFHAPVEGRGSFQKVGSKTEMANGTLGWGLPLFRMEGGREYSTLNGLFNQYNLVEQVSVSHSNDHFGDQEKSLIWNIGATYGETEFSVFMSTSFFSQTVNFDQRYGAGRFGFDWLLPHRQSLGLKVEHYLFRNDVKDVSSSYYDEDVLIFLFGDEFITVSEEEEADLIATLLKDDHMTSFASLHYEKEKIFELEGILGSSYYKEEQQDQEEKTITDEDWLVRTKLHLSKSNIELSHEEVGPDYVSMGSPTRYQNRKIRRVAPYLHLARFWKIYGEFRREDSPDSEKEDLPVYRNDYWSAVNRFDFKRNAIKLTGTDFVSSLYGRRLTGSADFTQFFGRHSLDIGGSSTSQWLDDETLYKESYAGRASLHIIYPSWKLAMGEDYIRHYYRTRDTQDYETISNLQLEIKGFLTYMQYNSKPKYIDSEERLYTGFVRMGHKVSRTKIFNLFYAATSLHSNLKNPEVWRAGVEYTYSF